MCFLNSNCDYMWGSGLGKDQWLLPGEPEWYFLEAAQALLFVRVCPCAAASVWNWDSVHSLPCMFLDWWLLMLALWIAIWNTQRDHWAMLLFPFFFFFNGTADTSGYFCYYFSLNSDASNGWGTFQHYFLVVDYQIY